MMTRLPRWFSGLVAAGVLVAWAGSSAPAADRGGSAGEDASSRSGMFTIQFEDVDLPVFIKFIGKATGRNFVFSEKVAGTVTVVSPTPVTADEAFVVFQSVLAVRGLTMIDDGIVTRIVPLKEARASGAGAISEAPGVAGFATRLIGLKHVGAHDVAGALETLVSKDGALTAYESTNTLIVSDNVSNLDRISEVVRALDIPSHEESVEVIPLQYADARVLAESISEILGKPTGRGAKDKGGPDGTSFKIVPDERTNSLVVVGPGPDRKRVAELAKGLDSPLAPGEERINVYYAKYADASALVDVISGMVSGRGVSRRTPPGATAAPGGVAAAAGRQASRPVGLSDDVSVTADPATNSVIISAGQQDYRIIVGLLESLDIQRPQVFVEAIIAEVTLDRTEALGFEFQAGGHSGDATGLARSSFGQLATAFTNPASLGGLILAASSDKTIELPDGTEIPAQAALFVALANDQDIEILSAPTLLTLDNEEARILVGENIPVITSQGADISNLQNVFTTVDRRDIGIKLTITPQVSEGDIVVLDVEEEVSALVENISTDIVTQIGPSYTIRTAETTVSVMDGRTAVIGGLISNSLATRVSKVPFLGDIPYLGRLFRSEAGRNERVNLIVVLTPHVIRNATDLNSVSDDAGTKYRGSLMEMPDFLGDPALRTPGIIPGQMPTESVPGEKRNSRNLGILGPRPDGL